MPRSDIAVVAIGRNEGARLLACLQSVVDSVALVVYVDSGSTDGSVDAARELGAEVVELDMSIPFTAARARNAGWRRVHEMNQAIEWVQFVDGDCMLDPAWLDTASAFLSDHQDVAVVCGRRRERFPEATAYNFLCDYEWNTPIGEAAACGGDALMRFAVLRSIDGYREDLIAGEEPEMCFRLRERGHRIWRLDAEMTLHDAAMDRFSQFWQRSKRAGYSYANGAWLHGRSPERYYVRECIRVWFWAAGIPLLALLGAVLMGPLALLVLLLYPLQWLRTGWRVNDAPDRRWTVASALTIGKFAEWTGQLKFLGDRLLGRRIALIEYKGA